MTKHQNESAEPWNGEERRRRPDSGKHFRAEDNLWARLNMLFHWQPGLAVLVVSLLSSFGTTILNRLVSHAEPVTTLRSDLAAETRDRKHQDSVIVDQIQTHESAVALARTAQQEHNEKLDRQISVLLVGQCSDHTRQELAYMQALVSFSCGPIAPRRPR